MSEAGEVTVHVDAPPERVYELVSNVTRMGEWSPECYRCEWQGGASGPAVGARFKGWNKQGVIKWSTTAEVKAADPGREFAFSTMGGDREQTRWRYRLEPSGGGTDVTESYEAIHTPWPVKMAEKVIMRNRPEQLQKGMRATLDRLKAVAESQPAS